MKVRNPRTGEFDYDLKEDDFATILSKCKGLRKNQPAWNALSLEERILIIEDFATQLENLKEEVQSKLSIDTARQKISSIEYEGTIGMIRGRCISSRYQYEVPGKRQSQTSPTVNLQEQWVPYQLVGVISPWNFPLLLALIDVIPALLAGSSVVLKPSEVTPRFIDPLEKAIAKTEGLSHVLQIVRGGPKVGKAIVDSVDAVCFTGSVPTGQHIAQRAAERFIPAFLELGGKDAAVVLEDADLHQTTDAILRSTCGATGQACQSLERIYVHASIYQSFLELLLEKVNRVELSLNINKGGTLGPLILEGQAIKIQNQIKDATQKGAKVLHGGIIKNLHGGLYLEPTVLTNVSHQMQVMTEESFGPVIPIMTFETEEQAISLVNDSIYGLSASVFSKDEERAIALASKINAGGISINDASLTNQVFDANKNSFNFSGLYHSRMGSEGFTRFFRKKALMIQKAAPKDIHTQDEPYTT